MRYRAFRWVSLLTFSTQYWFSLGQDDRPTSDPRTEDFLRRSLCSATVNGNYVYIDGGEISWKTDGLNALTNNFPSRSANLTLSIDLQSPWKTSSVNFRRTAKPPEMPKLNFQAIWKDCKSKGFYVWGGQTPYNNTVPASNIWHFDANDSGEGSWEIVTVDNRDDFNELKVPKGGAFAQHKDVAYYLGGFASGRTENSIEQSSQGHVALPGLVSFNMSSKRVMNVSSGDFGQHGTFRYGSMEAIPFGPEGLLLVLGGSQAPPSASRDSDWALMDFDHVYLHDIKTGKWHQQQTTGNLPTGREKFCTVGVVGPNNTYDIYMYGGRMGNNGDDGISNEVYVLTLPGFRFFKASVSSTIGQTPRVNHACVLVGRRQMLSIGGTSDQLSPEAWNNPDSWNRGLGIFDMMQWTWGDKYNADADEYSGREEVRQWYERGGMDNVSWGNDELKSLFAQKPASDPTGNASPNARSRPSVGAIVGGVLGGVVGLVLIIGIVLFFLKRKKRKATETGHVPDDATANPPAYEKRGPDGQQAFGSDGPAPRGSAMPEVHEMSGDFNAVELPGDHGTSETNGSNSRNEMAG